MSQIVLFDTKGRFVHPASETLAALTDAERANVAAVGVAAGNLDGATTAVTQAEQALRETRAEIAAIEKVLPRQTHTDLAKAFIADSNRRRAGL